MAARIAAIALALISSAALAQQPARVTLTVTVTDQSGALIPGAHVTATRADSGLRSEAIADPAGPSTGQATLQLEPGIYTLRVQAKGFKYWEERNVELKTATRRTYALPIDDIHPPCTLPCEPILFLVIPAEHPQLTTEIPMMPLQQMAPPARRLRSQHRSWRSSKRLDATAQP